MPETINEIKLSGQIVKIYPIRHTPNKTPILTFVLEHLSSQVEAGVARTVKCRVFCIIVNWQNNLEGELIDRSVVVHGFLSQNSKTQIVLNVKQIYG